MRTLFVSTIAVLSLLSVACADPPAGEAQPKAAPWVRLVDDPDRTVRMEVAMRTYAAPGKPDLLVAGAVHIADRPFYKALQEALDARDLVLFEGVKPSAAGPDDATASTAEKIDRSKGRVRLVGIVVERHIREHGAPPDSLTMLTDALAEDPRHQRWLEGARTDAWGNPIMYTTTQSAPGYEVMSLGADNKAGGSGADADIALSADAPISPSELGLTPGLQEQLAKTFRLRFQLEEMDESGPNWRNADLSIEQINERIKAKGGSGDFLFSMLDGSSGIAAFAGGMLSAMQAIPGAAPRGKLMIMELLSMADEDTLGAGMPGGEGLMEVIIEDRNQEVIDQLASAIENEPELATVGIVYGAGHMPDLEARLREQMGYAPVGDPVWVTAMRLPLERVGITPEERAMVRYSVLQQLAAAKRAKAKE
jgi:general secretion pathway protein G